MPPCAEAEEFMTQAPKIRQETSDGAPNTSRAFYRKLNAAQTITATVAGSVISKPASCGVETAVPAQPCSPLLPAHLSFSVVVLRSRAPWNT